MLEPGSLVGGRYRVGKALGRGGMGEVVEAIHEQLGTPVAIKVLREERTQKPELIERFLGLESTTHLSRAALETLAIIAYQQPVTRPQIDSIRGVNSDSMMKSLLNKGLILESGRADGPGRPILYSTTPEFLQHFGLNSILEMPPLAKQEEEGETHDEMLKG